MRSRGILAGPELPFDGIDEEGLNDQEKIYTLDEFIHVFSAGCEEIDRMLAFRDRLRDNEDDRRLYEETKRELAARTWKYTQDYADAKSKVVQEILARALGKEGDNHAF